jgi:hypothetical protein
MRPITPQWVLVEEVLSQHLGEVFEQRVNTRFEQNPSLRQGQGNGPPATAADEKKTDIKERFRLFVDDLKAIPREYMACEVVLKETAGAEGCQVPVPKETSFKELAPVLASRFGFNIDPATLAKVNGRRELEPVSPKNM